MPSAIIDICSSSGEAHESRLMQAVHASLVEAFQVSPVYRNVSLCLHAPHRLLGRTDSPAPEKQTNVSIFVLPGRSLAAKRRLYALITQRFEALGIPPPCVLIRLHELPPQNFGVRGGLPVCDVELGYPLVV